MLQHPFRCKFHVQCAVENYYITSKLSIIAIEKKTETKFKIKVKKSSYKQILIVKTTFLKRNQI